MAIHHKKFEKNLLASTFGTVCIRRNVASDTVVNISNVYSLISRYRRRSRRPDPPLGSSTLEREMDHQITVDPGDRLPEFWHLTQRPPDPCGVLMVRLVITGLST